MGVLGSIYLPECPNSGRRVKYNLCSIQTVSTPVEGVVATIADVNGDATCR